MNKRDQAILAWVNANRPDVLRQVECLLNDDAAIFLMAMAFEAGRTFQVHNPDAELGPGAY